MYVYVYICIYSFYKYFYIFCFLKEKIILFLKELSLFEKKKNIYCVFFDMKEIIIKKSVKIEEIVLRIINFVYSFILKI